MSVYSGKTVLVTGARGMGEALVKNMFSKGANVIVVSATSSGEKLAVSLPAATNKVIGIRCDLSSSTAATELAAKAIQASKDFGTGGKIDYLILCAAICPFVDLEHVQEEQWNYIFAVNVVGPTFLIKALVPAMSTDGSIVLFSSSGTFSSGVLPIYLPYMASKGAINQIARMLAKDPLLTSKGISTTVISPGTVATEMLLSDKTEAELKAYAATNPYGRLGEPEDIVMVVDSVLAGGKWLNGANLSVNGGSAV